MGAVVPFPQRRAPVEARGAVVPPEQSGEVVILAVVQRVRTAAVPPLPAGSAVHETH